MENDFSSTFLEKKSPKNIGALVPSNNLIITQAEATKRWKAKNPEKVKQQQQRHYERHREQLNNYNKQYKKMKRRLAKEAFAQQKELK